MSEYIFEPAASLLGIAFILLKHPETAWKIRQSLSLRPCLAASENTMRLRVE